MERGIRIKDANSGDIVATRDAYEADESGAQRTIQLVDFASRRNSFQLMRGFSDYIAADDSTNLESLNADILSGGLDVGDKSKLIVRVIHSVSDGGVNLTPLLINKIPTPLMTLTPPDPYNEGFGRDNYPLFSSHEVIRLRYGMFRGYAAFNLPFSSGSTISEAKLRLYSSARPPDQRYITIDHKKSDSDVSAAWHLYDGTDWDGVCSPIPALLDTDPDQWQEFDITSTVQHLVNESYYHPGLWYFRILITEGSGSENIDFSSSDNADGNTPELLTSATSNNYSILETKTTIVPTATLNMNGDYWHSPLLVWDVLGAEKIFMHVSGLSGGNGVKVYGSLI